MLEAESIMQSKIKRSNQLLTLGIAMMLIGGVIPREVLRWLGIVQGVLGVSVFWLGALDPEFFERRFL